MEEGKLSTLVIIRFDKKNINNEIIWDIEWIDICMEEGKLSTIYKGVSGIVHILA